MVHTEVFFKALDEVVGPGPSLANLRSRLHRKLCASVGLMPTRRQVLITTGVTATCSDFLVTLSAGVDMLHLMEQAGVLRGLPARPCRPMGPRPSSQPVGACCGASGASGPTSITSRLDSRDPCRASWGAYELGVVEWATDTCTRPGRLSDAAVQQLSLYLSNPAGACDCLLCRSLNVRFFFFVCLHWQHGPGPGGRAACKFCMHAPTPDPRRCTARTLICDTLAPPRTPNGSVVALAALSLYMSSPSQL
jgi:hypothetical protein